MSLKVQKKADKKEECSAEKSVCMTAVWMAMILAFSLVVIVVVETVGKLENKWDSSLAALTAENMVDMSEIH